MTIRRYRSAPRMLALAAALCCSVPAWSLDLAQAYRLAEANDATIRAARAAAAAGREQLPQARSQFFPNISAGVSRARNTLATTQPNFLGQISTQHDKYRSANDALTLRQPIYNKQISAQYHRAVAGVADANAQLERDEENLVMRVTQAYFEALLAQEQLRLIRLQETNYTTAADAARKSFAAGAGTRTDIEDAQARLDLARAQEVEARQNIEITQRQLQVLINQPTLEPLAPIDTSKLKLEPPQPATIGQWMALAEAASPELRSARAQVDVAKADVERAEAGHYPTLNAVAQISRSLSENPTTIHAEYDQKQIALQLNIPIWQGGYVNSQVRQAVAVQQQAEDKLDELRRDLGVRVQREFSGMNDGVAKVKALEQAVQSAQQSVESSRKSFEAGARTRLDILNAEAQAGQARHDLAQARFAYLVARVRLTALAGGLKAQNIDEINGWLQH
ncbi:MAG TPA: TolC family outer membrane protein [Ramlibacter sp.]|nr:TolC family outer membrane protein [Ramlibacter sp.]